MDPALETKLRELVDRQEIWAVLQRYARGVDRCDRDLLATVYWPDAIEDHGAFLGAPPAFIDWVIKIAGRFGASFHGLLTHACELDGDDAHCETYFLSIRHREAPPFPMSAGRYVDHFQRRGGEWRIANRVTVVEGHYELPDKPGSGAATADRSEPWRAAQDRTDVSYHRPLRPRRPGRSREP